MLRFRCDHVANTLSVTTNRDRASPLLAGSPTEQRLTALHSRSPPQRTYGLLQTRPRGSFAAQPAALKPPGPFRAAPLPHRCRVPSARAPGQDFHLRSQHPYSAHQGHRCAASCAGPCRAGLDSPRQLRWWAGEVGSRAAEGGGEGDDDRAAESSAGSIWAVAARTGALCGPLRPCGEAGRVIRRPLLAVWGRRRHPISLGWVPRL
jgi:hypothetical protein